MAALPLLDVRHLRTVLAIDAAGSLSRAAERLHITQSALSHQIRGLEEALGLPLFLRSSKPLRLTAAGQRVLALARRVLPELESATVELMRMAKGETGRLYIAIECHACFEWLLPVLDRFRRDWPEVEVDIRVGLSFDALPALQRGDVDLVISSDPGAEPDLQFDPLFDYEAQFVAAAGHPLAARPHIEPPDLAGETLITYPVERRRLDVFSHFLTPAGIEPAATRQVELTSVILLLVASDRGVSVLPDWVVRALAGGESFTVRRLGPGGLVRTLFAAVRVADRDRPFVRDFVAIARSAHAGRAPAD
ncbi:MAG: LysR family transcriptional regulator [Acetobacterales bacterium]